MPRDNRKSTKHGKQGNPLTQTGERRKVMSHLLRYEDAEYKVEQNPCQETYLEAARAALEVHDHKTSNRLCWYWANIALDWATKAEACQVAWICEPSAGVGKRAAGREVNFGHGRRPRVEQLRVLLAEGE
jgi:hypothetical protein